MTFSAVLSLRAAELPGITGFKIGADGHFVLQYTADANSYYILRKGEQVTAVQAAKDMQLGTANSIQLRDPDLAATVAFYRVQQVPLASPLDTDGDGIDDVYEFQHRSFLDPLNLFDAAQDPDGDGLTNLQEYQRGSDPVLSEYVAPSVQTVPSPTRAGSVTVTGTAKPNTTVKIDGGLANVTTTAGANATYSVEVILQTNRLNRLFVSTSGTNGQTSALQPLEVVQDSQPPSVFIDFPTHGSVLTTENTVIAGRVGDMLSGFMGLDVTVTNLSLSSISDPPSPIGGRANVVVGIGNNGTYERGAVPLALGPNIIQVIATDKVGNSVTNRITLTRAALSGPRLIAESGDAQISNVHRRLGSPLVVRLTQADGVTPIANRRVTFDVIRSDGRLLPVEAGQLAADYTTRPDVNESGSMQLQLNTDATGQAQVYWTLGGDAGCGNNRIAVTSAGISNTVFFCASAKPALPRQINIGSGNNQKTETGSPAPEPLRAWVNDSCNGIAGILVTFTVVQGSGRFYQVADEVTRLTLSTAGGQSLLTSPATSITVPTSLTGHATVNFQLGPDTGQNVIEANYPGNPGLPATFILYGVARDLTKPTTLTGLVLDNSSQPIGGALCEIFVPPDQSNPVMITHTDAQGRFAFTNTPTGAIHLFVFGSSATSIGTNAIPPNSFPFLTYPMTLIPNAENSLPHPVLLPRLNPKNAVLYNGTTNLVLTCEGMDGLKMTIQANSMRDARGRLVTPQNPATVSLNQVHHDQIPMPIPDGASPPFAWTLQPARATFDPPVQIEYPNMSGLPAGTIANFLSYNHDTERFEIVASGHVDEQGATIRTDKGAGLTIAGWGCNCPPYSVTGDCEKCNLKITGSQMVAIDARITLKVNRSKVTWQVIRRTGNVRLIGFDNFAFVEGQALGTVVVSATSKEGGETCTDDLVVSVCDPKVPESIETFQVTGAAQTHLVDGYVGGGFSADPPKADITPYCDLSLASWKAKVTSLEQIVYYDSNLSGFIPITAALIEGETDCLALQVMIEDLIALTTSVDPILCKYALADSIIAHERVHRDQYVRAMQLAYDKFRQIVENISINIPSLSATQAKSRIVGTSVYQNALKEFQNETQEFLKAPNQHPFPEEFRTAQQRAVKSYVDRAVFKFAQKPCVTVSDACAKFRDVP